MPIPLVEKIRWVFFRNELKRIYSESENAISHFRFDVDWLAGWLAGWVAGWLWAVVLALAKFSPKTRQPTTATTTLTNYCFYCWQQLNFPKKKFTKTKKNFFDVFFCCWKISLLSFIFSLWTRDHFTTAAYPYLSMLLLLLLLSLARSVPKHQ